MPFMVSVNPACVATVSARVCRLFALRSFNNHCDDGKTSEFTVI